MAEMTLLQMAQEIAPSIQVPVPSTVVGAQDDLTLQVWKIFNDGIRALSDDYEFQQLVTLRNFGNQQYTDYGALDWGSPIQTIAVGVQVPVPTDFKYMVTESLWDKTNRRRVFGPLSIQQWQQLIIFQVSQAVYSYTMYGQILRIYPQTLLTEVDFTCYYGSCFGVADASSPVHFTRTYETDTATCRLPSNLVLADFKWRWKREKGLPYAEDKDIATRMCLNEVGRVDQGTIDMGGETQDAFPALYIPTFNSPGHP